MTSTKKVVSRFDGKDCSKCLCPYKYVAHVDDDINNLTGVSPSIQILLEPRERVPDLLRRSQIGNRVTD